MSLEHKGGLTLRHLLPGVLTVLLLVACSSGGR